MMKDALVHAMRQKMHFGACNCRHCRTYASAIRRYQKHVGRQEMKRELSALEVEAHDTDEPCSGCLEESAKWRRILSS